MQVSRRELFSQLLNPGMLASPLEIGPKDGDQLLLERTSYGVRPQALDRIRAIGRDAYLREQLDADALDDPEGDAFLAKEPIWSMSWTELYRDSEYGRISESLMDGIAGMAIHSRRQLKERMVDFWRDHFNVAADAIEMQDLLHYEKDVLRPHALGNFKKLLSAVAASPAMLVYLDNAFSSAEHPNENYARELLELHTLGVDGGYTEKDVYEVSRAFTGWTYHPKGRNGFYFETENHDFGTKEILGYRFPAERGIEDGLHVLSIVANHPSTARFLSRKLCVYFVSDNPPQSLVDSTTAVWTQSKGEIGDVLFHILTSAEFEASAGKKLRRPFDFMMSAMSATGTRTRNPWTLQETLMLLGHAPYGWPAPNGYPTVAAAWANTGGLLNRWNTAMWLTHSAYSDPDWAYDLTTELRDRIGEPATVGEMVDQIAIAIWGIPLRGSWRQQFVDYASNFQGESTQIDRPLIARKLASTFGLMLSSPLFQWT